MSESDEWLRRYYETGDNDHILQIVRHYGPLVDRFLGQCVRDPQVRVKIWLGTIHQLRQSRRHPELRWDLNRGTLTGFIFAVAMYLAYRWLVLFEDPREAT
jgi:hypothetical protein